MTAKAALFVLLAAIGIAFCLFWYAQAREKASGRPTWIQLAIGAVTDFFDTLGVGSFATTTSLYKLGGVVADEKIPGTLNVGHTVPTFAEAFIFIAVVEVEMTTLVLMIAAAVAGAWLGAGVVARWPRRRIQIGMGVAVARRGGHHRSRASRASCPAAATRSASRARAWRSASPATSCWAR